MKWRSLQESGARSELRPLREVYAERKEAIAKYVPAEVRAVHSRAVAKLKADNLAERVVERWSRPGAKFPDFELRDHSGNLFSLPGGLVQSRLVVMFIRGRWCPFCVAQMEAMSALAPKIEATGTAVVAVSPQTEKHAFFMHNQHRLGFPVLVDAHNHLAHQLGLAYRLSDEQQALYRSTFVNLPFVNGDARWELPIPATFVIERDGAVLFASANEDYTERPESLEILSILEGK